MNGKIEGNYTACNNEQNHGMITGDVTVKNGSEFVNHGMICKDVIVETEGAFYNHGMVKGDIIGTGYVEVWGMVIGNVAESLRGIIHKNAVVDGEKYVEDRTLGNQ